MQSWRIMLGPFVIWALHFVAVYALASAEAIADPGTAPGWRLAGLVFSGLCLAALVGGAVWIYRRGSISPLARLLGLGGGVIATIAVVWQSLPLVVSSLATSQL